MAGLAQNAFRKSRMLFYSMAWVDTSSRMLVTPTFIHNTVINKASVSPRARRGRVLPASLRLLVGATMHEAPWCVVHLRVVLHGRRRQHELDVKLGVVEFFDGVLSA